MTRRMDPDWAWAPFKPSSESPWDLKKVGHLYRRATFGATWAQLEEGVKAGPDKTIAAVLNGNPSDPDFDDMMAKTRNGLVTGNNGTGATAWWLYRMLYGPHPLREKVT